MLLFGVTFHKMVKLSGKLPATLEANHKAEGSTLISIQIWSVRRLLAIYLQAAERHNTCTATSIVTECPLQTSFSSMKTKCLAILNQKYILDKTGNMQCRLYERVTCQCHWYKPFYFKSEWTLHGIKKRYTIYCMTVYHSVGRNVDDHVISVKQPSGKGQEW